MANHYIISAFGPDRKGLVDELSSSVFKNHFNISDSRMAILGDHFSVLMLIAGEASNLAGLTAEVNGIKSLAAQVKEVSQRSLSEDRFEYAIRIMGNDAPGLVRSITHHLKTQGANVASMETWIAPAPHSGTEIFNMHIVAEVPGNTSFREFKDSLVKLCDKLNLDVDIEPFKRD